MHWAGLFVLFKSGFRASSNPEFGHTVSGGPYGAIGARHDERIEDGRRPGRERFGQGVTFNCYVQNDDDSCP